MTEYKFNRKKNINNDILEWARTVAGFQNIRPFSSVFIVEINHADQNAQTAFEEELAIRLGDMRIDNQYVNPAKFINEIKSDIPLWDTEVVVTKSNLGTVYENVFSDFGGRPFYVDTRGFTKLAVKILWTKVGSGVQRLRIVDHANDTQVLESTSLTTQSNDFPSVDLPQPFLNFRGNWRIQCKTTVQGDSPIFAGMRIYLRR